MVSDEILVSKHLDARKVVFLMYKVSRQIKIEIMDIQRVQHLKSIFDTVVHVINNDDDSEQLEVWLAGNYKNFWDMQGGRILL